jgi:hypothetical protein
MVYLIYWVHSSRMILVTRRSCWWIWCALLNIYME